ncbi:MAG: hypothetical protein HRT88_15730 [Lentisphaeraceae bacterium]|nr:hypothetical protein [Lentisphaeraceae bacterium]
MNQALVVMRMTLRLIMRKGTLWGMLAIIIALSTLTFSVARSDGILVKELEIRLTYSYGLTYSLLSLMIIALSCFTIRSQIDAKNIHLMSSMPINRKWLLLGQAFALIVVAFVCEVVLMSSLAFNSWYFSRSFDADAISLAKEKYFQPKRFVLPDYKERKELTIEYCEKYKIDLTGISDVDWENNHRNALMEEQFVAGGKSKSWSFSLDENPQQGETLAIIYRFQKAKRSEKITGLFKMTSSDASTYFEKEIEAHQYSEGKVEIPIADIPLSGNFKITFTNKGGSSVILTRTGLKVAFVKGSLSENMLKSVICQMGHLSVAVVVGLCAGVGLTFSVASFLVMMLYLLSVGQGLFDVVIEDMKFAFEMTFLDQLVIAVMEGGTWLTKGLQPPAVIDAISSGVNIDWTYILTAWLPVTLCYGLVAFLLGGYMLNSKELDKVQT